MQSGKSVSDPVGAHYSRTVVCVAKPIPARSERTNAALRVAIIGGRRARHGNGPYLARHFARAGAQLCGALVTSARTAREARRELAELGLHVDTFSDLAKLLDQGPDILVIASPTETHRDFLAEALRARVHVLCEKPLLDVPLSRPPHSGNVSTAVRSIAHAFSRHHLVLEEVCQWPGTLESFRRLYPNVDLGRATAFRMHIGSPYRGRLSVLQMLPHPLSLLQGIAPGRAVLEDVEIVEASATGERCTIGFTWRLPRRALDCTVELTHCDEYPRPFEYSVDGHLCKRRVELPDYRLHFGDEAQGWVEAEDPVGRLVSSFLSRVAEIESTAPASVPNAALIHRQVLLEELLSHHDQIPH